MKKLLTLFVITVSLVQVGYSQLPDGTTAPNWTMSDINGGSHTLYNYLNDNKVVFIDFSATWCGPCWNYHNTHSINNVYNSHSSDVMAFMIEGDDDTNTDCLYGLSTCVGGTQGNWVSGTDYPIIDNHTQNGAYAIGYWPTIYGVCPDKKIYEVGQINADALWDFAKGCSAPTLEIGSVADVDCFGNNSGSITLSVSGGMPPFDFSWSNGATTQNLSGLAPGSYSVTVTGSLGGTKTLGPITVEGPSTAISMTSSEVTPAGCNGVGGTVSIGVQGGTPGYTFLWSNGSTAPGLTGLTAGTYSAVVSDANGCDFNTPEFIVDPPTYPDAVASDPAPLTCTLPAIELDGSGSSTGNNMYYLWTTTNGNIVSGSTTLNDCVVNAAGTYLLTVTNAENQCSSAVGVSLAANQVAPTASAGPPGTLSCAAPQTSLNGTGSSGATFNILWTTTGGNIVSGATTFNPVVNGAGGYTLTITNNTNGCTTTSLTTVASNIALPDASATGGQLTCIANTVNLSGSSTTPGVNYNWVGPNGYNSNQQNPTATTQGTYVLTVTNPANGCTKTANTEVTQNTAAPNAAAQGGTLTCAATSVALSGSSTTTGVSYAWTGPNGYTSNQQNPTVGTAGNYALTVTGTNGCTQGATAVVGQNTTVPNASAGPQGVLNCNANQVVLNGTASSNGSQFAYLWTTADGNITGGATTLTPTVNEDGTYSILVTNNANGCTSTASTGVIQRLPVAATITSQNDVLCNGSASGSATAAGSGGNGTFSYAWSNGANTANVSNLSAGSYTVSVTDGEGCGQTKSVTISQPTELVPNASTTAQSAPGVNDGTATASPQGGTGNYTYQWNTGQTTQTISGLAPGNYTVSVLDGNSCLKTQTVTVNAFGCSVLANTTSTDVTCNGNTDGTASISLSNATSPTVYAWSNGANTQSVSNLAVGTYTVSATDGNGCEVVATVEVDQPATLGANATTTPITAAGADDGTATANPTGGTGPFTYSWSTGANTQTITGLASANYTVSVTDANGCVAVQTVPVAPFGCSALATITANNISCFGETDGQATVVLVGGLTPYTYAWSNGASTATISDLPAGTYSVAISDAVGCPATAEVVIAEPAALEAELGQVANTDCGVANGSASVSPTGGTGNYNIVWSNGQTGTSVNGLAAGNYVVSVTDENSCQAQVSVQISVNDSEAPTVLVLQDYQIALDGNGEATLSPSQVNNGSFDNCTIASMSLNQTNFTCTDLGNRQVTLTVVDEAGNAATATANITIFDTQDPIISVGNIILSLDENGEATLDPSMLDDGSTDNCGIVERTISQSSFNCNDLGQNAVVLTIADASNNQAAGTAIVTVEDKIAPAISCPDNLVLPNCEPVGNFAAIQASDNCAASPAVEQIAGLPSGATFPVGLTTQTFEANDGHGNTNTCTFTVQVLPAMEVELAGNNVSCNGEANGKLTAEVTGGNQGYTYLWSNGATTQSISDLGPGQFSVSVTDADGCTTTQSATVTEPTAVVSVPLTIKPETVGQQNGAIDVDVTGGTQPYSYEWQDPNGNVISDQQDIEDLAAGIYRLEVTDGNDCVSLHYFTVQSVSSANQRYLERAIGLFPNPTSGKVTISFKELEALEAGIAVFDLNGKLVSNIENASIAAGQYQLDINSQADGVYLVRILVENQVVTKRLVVQH